MKTRDPTNINEHNIDWFKQKLQEPKQAIKPH